MPYRYASFAEIKRGDCTVRNGEFRFYQNGATRWECEASSTDTGDEWDGTFTGGDASFDGGPQGLLFAVLESFHFDIKHKNEWKDWLQAPGPDKTTYLNGVDAASAYRRLMNVVFHCKC